MSELKLFFVIDDTNSSLTVPEKDLLISIKNAFEEWDERTPKDELPVFTVSPVYMTQEEFESMPEYNG